MFKKGLTVHLLLIWCAVHLLTPFAAVCSTGCSGIKSAPVAAPASHACCPKNFRPITEISSTPACVCPIVLRKPARLETEIVLSPLEEKNKVQSSVLVGGVFFISVKLLENFSSPPGNPAFQPSDCSGNHSILRI